MPLPLAIKSGEVFGRRLLNFELKLAESCEYRKTCGLRSLEHLKTLQKAEVSSTKGWNNRITTGNSPEDH
jgi:hypothetical protein